MLNLKISVFAISLVAAAFVGGLGATIVVQQTTNCAPGFDKEKEDAFLKKFFGGKIIEGPSKGY